MGRVRRPGEKVKKDKREGAAVGVVNAYRHALRFTLPAGIAQRGGTGVPLLRELGKAWNRDS